MQMPARDVVACDFLGPATRHSAALDLSLQSNPAV